MGNLQRHFKHSQLYENKKKVKTKKMDHFLEAQGGDDFGQDEVIHIRIQQRNGRKTLTTVQGIDPKFDLKKLVKACKKEFACNGTVVEHKEYGEVMQFQGDQREHIRSFLLKIQLTNEDNLKTHGF